MAVDSMRTLFGSIAALPAAVREQWEKVEAGIESGAPTTAELQHLAAEIDGLLTDVKSARDDLDIVDAADYIRGTHPDQLVTVWRAERETRRQLVQMAKGLRDLRDSVTEIAGGVVRSLYITRDGDTLQKIAAHHLGDWQQWPALLDANPDLDPGPVASGTLVTIPART